MRPRRLPGRRLRQPRTRAPYVRGALFYRAVAARIGAAALDRALAAFYAARVTRAATMADLLAAIREATGYDPAACAERWLHTPARPPPGACP
jgi:aminopeptidase N